MIKKLRKRIFLIVTISLSIVVIGAIMLFAFFNYRNTLNTSTMMLDRFVGGERRPDEKPEDIPNESDSKEERKAPEDEIINSDIQLDGLYYIMVENGEVKESSGKELDDKLKQYALEIASKKQENGIIGKYVFRTRRISNGREMVILIESEETISRANSILIVSGIISILAIIIIIFIAKKIAKIIVKPVEETIEKQKQFISDASHELKTPLAVIEANADVLENELGKNKWLAYIQNEIGSMEKLINELLLLAKIENVDSVKENTSLDLSKEAEIVVSMFESMAFEKNVKLETNIKENIYFISNKQDIEHILSTLIDNAIKHTKEKDKVKVELNKERNDIIIQVKNEGDPIPEGEREKIFERFYRVDKSRNRNEKRYGLGLAIAKSTVEKYKGKIEVECKDHITNFKVIIPA